MREGFLLPGVVLLTLVVLFSFVPLPYPSSGEASSSSSLIFKPPAFPYGDSAPVSVEWSGGNVSTWVELVPCVWANCTDVKAPGAAPTPPMPRSWAAEGKGAQGTFTVWIPTNQSLIVITNAVDGVSITVTLNEMPEFGFLWTILLLFGVLLTVPGMLLPERGSPRGHQRRLHYFHWRHHPFALPPHLPVAGLTCPACGLADIPHEDDNCPRCGAQLPRSSTMGAAPAMVPAAGPGPAPLESVTGPGPSAETAPTPSPAAAGTAEVAAAGAAEVPSGKKRVAVDKSKVAGQSLSVADADPLRPWRVVRGLGFAPEDVLVFTREDPQVLQERYQFDPQLIYTIGRSEGPQVIAPAESERIADLADQHLLSRPGSLVVLSDPNYFVTHVGFETLRRLTHALQDHARDRKGTFLLAFNPQVLSTEQRAQLEERMRKVL